MKDEHVKDAAQGVPEDVPQDVAQDLALGGLLGPSLSQSLCTVAARRVTAQPPSPGEKIWIGINAVCRLASSSFSAGILPSYPSPLVVMAALLLPLPSRRVAGGLCPSWRGGG